MSHLTLFFEPLDVLQFRDHRPFDAGLNVRAHSVFPSPSVFLGCLRTALFRQCGANFHIPDPYFGIIEGWAKEALGSRTVAGSLTLRGPLLASWDGEHVRPYFPLPLDLATLSEDRHQVLCPFRPTTLRFVGGQMQKVEGNLPWTGQIVEKKHPIALWLNQEGARIYLDAGSAPLILAQPAQAVPQESLFVREDRIGIARDGTTLTVDEGMFYVSSTFRLARGCGFAVDVWVAGQKALHAALQKLDGQVVPLGGKAHRARVRLCQGDLGLPSTASKGKRKVWLLTPAVLDLGTHPPACLATNRALPLGGYDLAARAPRPLRRALPPGTIIYLSDEGPVDLRQRFLLSSEDARAGYGTFTTGSWE